MALALSGRYAIFGRQAAHGLSAWARASGVTLDVVDAGSGASRTRRAYESLAGGVDLLFGPYGSGPLAAACDALSGRPDVLWNHGGASVTVSGARVVSVLAPAERYWSGLATVLAASGMPTDRVAVFHADSPFGRATAAGAGTSLASVGCAPLLVAPFNRGAARARVAEARAAGAAVVIGCGRLEDDLALGEALAGTGLAVGLVACGVAEAAVHLGEALIGWLGPAQWLPGGPTPPVDLGAGAEYPAAQAAAAGVVALRALRAAGSPAPNALWDAARGLRTRTFLGPFEADPQGRQSAHAPLIVRWEPGEGGPVRRPVWQPPGARAR